MPTYQYGIQAIRDALLRAGWLHNGVHFVVDGQFGSTGKGALAAVIAAAGRTEFNLFTSNAGPNSGHTAYVDDLKVVTQQVPVGAAVLRRMTGVAPRVFLNAGAIINPTILRREVDHFELGSRVWPVLVHPCAAVILQEHVDAEQHNGSSKVAGTAKGVGAALADKINRAGNLYGKICDGDGVAHIKTGQWDFSADGYTALYECSQGFSLGLNEPRFAPHTTSRECTTQQAASDARIPLSKIRGVALSLRTFPIRVGNTSAGYSGDCYPDQRELTWEEVGQPPETTTVTGRVRRVFSWSWAQFDEAVTVNEPNVLFINFLNYLPLPQREPFLEQARERFFSLMGFYPEILVGLGPLMCDVALWRP